MKNMNNMKLSKPVIHSIQVGENIVLKIIACEEYSSNRITITEGEIYHVWCDEKQRWKDSIISSTPIGYFNLFALIAGMRVKKTKCFCLCGVFDKKDSTGFPIGMDKTFTIPNGCNELSFFPNDTKNFYGNNHGSININLMRLK